MLSIIFLGSDQDFQNFSAGNSENIHKITHVAHSEGLNNDLIRNSELILLSYEWESQNSLPLCHQLRQLNPHLLFILLVDSHQADQAIEAFHSGAFDVLSKPLNPLALTSSIKKSENFIAHRAYIYSQKQPLEQNAGEPPIAVSTNMRRTLTLLHQIADKEIPTLLNGETGTGKSVIASYLHSISPRKHAHFLTVNCGALSPSLLESELFGHEKGAFTGALNRRVGLLEAADGGTLFLDEINSASPELQIRLLQFIQDRKLLRIGSRNEITVDVRLIFASNQPLRPLVEAGQFREDLYFRLNVFPIDLPALRERAEDISHLAARFMFKHAPKLGKTVNSCGPGVLNTLQNYHWPGNVRELENVMQRALILCENERIELKDLPAEIVAKVTHPDIKFEKNSSPFPDDATLAEVEKIWIRKILSKYDGNKLRASKALGINQTTLWRKLKTEDEN
ncbi:MULTISPECIES: sigma-54-dependent transcriptional regulator [Thiomicrorhabdus]|uniref:Sigma-54-dependent Fis family transcriptional regulator n=1 Tax=Thiomicrorhabdus heinhorstiae TaxID=2748010 RepID=A0ABS0BZE7_9GAMM|nr:MULTISPECIES: sigma-54 dependent transcriptional regulator [Thiomicrorhabdus]MBF6058221.1 sigma-54-dependent Fis family transcriptional regulator [Thiomicrorhabdus heinhorstiae]